MAYLLTTPQKNYVLAAARVFWQMCNDRVRAGVRAYARTPACRLVVGSKSCVVTRISQKAQLQSRTIQNEIGYTVVRHAIHLPALRTLLSRPAVPHCAEACVIEDVVI